MVPKAPVEDVREAGRAKPRGGEGGRKVDEQEPSRSSREVAPTVSEKTRRGAEARDPRQWEWVEAEVWTERMLAALGNGVKGGKWFSMIINAGPTPTSPSGGFSP